MAVPHQRRSDKTQNRNVRLTCQYAILKRKTKRQPDLFAAAAFAIILFYCPSAEISADTASGGFTAIVATRLS